ncbi:hypothetical protein [uncultured Bacteroides sp.]|uniref:hypothetical protein n=1 Tax=uncultured Bacteroides sp. TaxID=162156 RepID=UPI002AAC361B|nr:hypothetical protein [uncultured Bacteroides sp.]
MIHLDSSQFSQKYKDAFYLKVSKNIKYYIEKFIGGTCYTCKGTKVKIDGDKEVEDCLNRIVEEAYLKKIILGPPSELRKVITDMPPNSFLNSSKLNLILYKIFVDGVYEGKTLKSTYTQKAYVKTSCIDKIKHIKQLKQRTCPYCNRNYIFSIEIDRGKANPVIAKPQLDHFYPKSSYPFLGASLYNLIPSCSFCNGLEVKGEISPINNNNEPKVSEIIMNPFEFDNSKFKFSYNLKNIDTLSIDENDVDIVVDGEKKYIDGYQHILGTVSLYEGHKDVIVEMIKKYALQYPESNQDFLNNLLSDNKKVVNNEEINKIFWGFENVENRYHLKSFSKFMNDIYASIMDDKK